MPLSCNWPTKVITIPKSELTLVSGTYYTLDVTYYFQLLRELNGSVEGIAQTIGFPLYLNTSPTSGTPRIVDIINGYTIAFEDGLYSVDFKNGNTNWRTVEIRNQVSVGTDNTAAFINPVFLEAALFLEGVYINTTPGEGYAGTGYTASGAIIGTRQAPSSNIPDALAIAAFRGHDTLIAVKSLTTDGTEDLTNIAIRGLSGATTGFTLTDGTITDGLILRDLNVNGYFNGNFAVIERCSVGDIFNFNNYIYQSFLYGTIHVNGTTALSNVSIAPSAPGQTATIDFGDADQTVIISEWGAGRLLCKNMTTANAFLGASGTGGLVVVDASVTDGSIVYGGSLGIDSTLGSPTLLRNSGVGEIVIGDSRIAALIAQMLDMYQFGGYDISNAVAITGDGTTQSVLTVDSKVQTITPTAMVRT